MTQTKKTKRTFIKNEVIAFLKGAAPLDGRWFGDKDEKGYSFWWRKYLPNVEVKP